MRTLEYAKMILDKVSFDQKLFEKELYKALRKLLVSEIKELKNWCYEKYGNLYAPILNQAFISYS